MEIEIVAWFVILFAGCFHVMLHVAERQKRRLLEHEQRLWRTRQINSLWRLGRERRARREAP